MLLSKQLPLISLPGSTISKDFSIQLKQTSIILVHKTPTQAICLRSECLARGQEKRSGVLGEECWHSERVDCPLWDNPTPYSAWGSWQPELTTRQVLSSVKPVVWGKKMTSIKYFNNYSPF